MTQAEPSRPTNPILPTIVNRSDIPILTAISIDGARQCIGDVRDFRRDWALSNFMPNNGRTSLSWVRLRVDEKHKVHRHPLASMVIVFEGNGELVGDLNRPIVAGDIVMIPPQALHGFVGRGDTGFSGLSVQFEGNGIFEAAHDPKIVFDDIASGHGLDPLEAAQRTQSEEYAHNHLIKLINGDAIRQNKRLQKSLLDILQVWSDHFQHLIRIRAASTKEPSFATLADTHLREEFDHNHILAEMRGNRSVQIWDPVLESAYAWFAERMAKASDVEATIIMHMVIEEAGDIFHKKAAEVFPGSQHFTNHANHDQNHASMGLEVLKEHSRESVEQMIGVLNHAWAIMNLLCNRIAELAITLTALDETGVRAPDARPQKGRVAAAQLRNDGQK